jgi:hypothetical protein
VGRGRMSAASNSQYAGAGPSGSTGLAHPDYGIQPDHSMVNAQTDHLRHQPLVHATVAGDDGDDDDAAGPSDTAEEKRLKRMRRNRESAAQSRNRKKQYVETLESQISNLQAQVRTLHSENYDLRREHARITGAPEPPIPPELMPEDDGGTAAAAGLSGMPDAVAEVASEVPVAPVVPATITHLGSARPSSPGQPSPGQQAALHGLELLSRSASHDGAVAAECASAAASMASGWEQGGGVTGSAAGADDGTLASSRSRGASAVAVGAVQ